MPAELLRDVQSRRTDEGRALAVRVYVREYAETIDVNRPDGRYLHEVLQSIGDELAVLMMKDQESRREIALTMTKLQEARHWAIELAVKKNSMTILDRRRFKQ